MAPNAEVVFDVPRGHAGTRLAEVLQQAGVDVPSWKMALALRLRGDAARIKAGNYLVQFPFTITLPNGFAVHSTWGSMSFPLVHGLEDVNTTQSSLQIQCNSY